MSSPQVREAEDRFTTRVFTALTSWLGQVGAAVLSPVRRFSSQPDPAAVYSTVGDWFDHVQSFGPDLEQAARIGWSQVTGEPVFSSSAYHVAEALAATQNLLRNIPDEVHDLIQREIATSLGAGEDVDGVAARVDRLLSATGSDRWPGRAQKIAMTEVTRASNAGALSAAIAAEAQLGPMLKRWNDSDDEKVRPTHHIVDRDELPLLQPFNVGGASMQYPADPAGPPEEVIFCRCDLSFRRTDG